MKRSIILFSKDIVIHSDGCMNTRHCRFVSKDVQKILIRDKDHKFFQKSLKNKTLTKKKVVYRNKIF